MIDLNFTKKKPKVKFTQEEDNKLKRLVSKLGTNDWITISFEMPGRNPRQCRERWLNYLTPNVVNGPWTEDEDELLIQKYNELGPKWKQIASFFPTRTDINIKSRFHLKERRKKKEELQKKRKILDKKINQMCSVISYFSHQKSLTKNIQNFQIYPQIEYELNKLTFDVKSMKNTIKEANCVSQYINSSPLPFISENKMMMNNNDCNTEKENVQLEEDEYWNMLLVDNDHTEIDAFFDSLF